MRVALIITFLLSTYTGYAAADITIRYDSINEKHKQPAHLLMVKQELVRINHKQGQQADVMLNLATGDIVQLDTESKRFFRINTQTINQYVDLYRQNKGLMQALINQGVQHLDPQKRNQIEQMMQRYDQGSNDPSVISFKNTGNVDQVLGVQCQIYALIEQGLHLRDVCLADYKQLQLEPADIQSFEQLKKAVRQFRQSSPNQQDMLTVMAAGFENLNGVPLKMVNYYPTGQIKSVIQAGSISLRPVPRMAYQIPADYQEKLTPLL